MKLNPPKKNTFWIAVGLAAVGVVIYAAHVLAYIVDVVPFNLPYLQPIAFLFVVVAFVLLCLGLTLKGF